MTVEPKVVTLKSPGTGRIALRNRSRVARRQTWCAATSRSRVARNGARCRRTVYLHGAGVYDSNMKHAIGEAELGRLALDANADGILNGQPPMYKELARANFKATPITGFPDLDDGCRRQMLQRLYRSLQF